MPLLSFTKKGIYCKQADTYIDAWRAVKRCIITHGHSDHAKTGHQHYLCHSHSKEILKHRLGQDIDVSTKKYGETFYINGVKFSLHPAGHIIGSAQVRVEYKGEVWVVTGDYKTEDDGFTPAFESVPCHTMISECTFGLPIYKWRPQAEIAQEINDWWRDNREADKVSILTGYSLGKAQRLLSLLDSDIGPIYTHGAIENMTEIVRLTHPNLPETTLVTKDRKKADFKGAIVVAPPSAIGSPWVKKFSPYSTAMASGWMAIRGSRRWRSADRGFALSDHADWEGLNDAIKSSGCETVITTHGFTKVFTRWLQEQGYNAYEENTEFEGEQADTDNSQEEAA